MGFAAGKLRSQSGQIGGGSAVNMSPAEMVLSFEKHRVGDMDEPTIRKMLAYQYPSLEPRDVEEFISIAKDQGSAATQMLGLTGAGAGGALTLGAAARAGGRMKEQEQKPTQGPSGLRLDMESAQRLQDLISGLTEEELRKVYPLLQKQGY